MVQRYFLTENLIPPRNNLYGGSRHRRSADAFEVFHHEIVPVQIAKLLKISNALDHVESTLLKAANEDPDENRSRKKREAVDNIAIFIQVNPNR